MEEFVPYSLTEVTVFPDRAQVRCRGEVELTPQVKTLVFDGLPLSLDQGSVRVSGAGTTAVTILAVDVVREHYVQSPSSVVQTLESEIEAAREELQAVEDDQDTWQAEADQLAGLRQATREYARGLARGQMSVEDQNNLLVYIRNQDREIRKEQRTLESQARLLRRRLEKLEKDLADQRSAQPRSRFQVRVSVAVEAEGQFFPLLTYVVRHAGWRPLYDLHYLDGPKELHVSTYAQISQRTGQDWNDVDLIVSTARPSLSQRVPELHPWYIDSYIPPPPVPSPLEAANKLVTSRQMMMADADFTAESFAEPETMLEAGQAAAEIDSGDAVVTYRVAGSCTVESDGAPHKFFLNKFRPQTTLSYLSVPRHTNAVFRRLEAINSAQAPLLEGEASLFFDDEYIGKTRLTYTPAMGEVELLLGVEERIEVKRELARRSVDKKLLKDHRVIHYGYEIELKNLLDQTADLELRDQIPVSRHEEIQVKLDEARPNPSERTDLNMLEWQLSLEPGSESTVRYTYTVQSPRTMRVVGLQD